MLFPPLEAKFRVYSNFVSVNNCWETKDDKMEELMMIKIENERVVSNTRQDDNISKRFLPTQSKQTHQNKLLIIFCSSFFHFNLKGILFFFHNY